MNSTAAPVTQPGSCWRRPAPWLCLVLLTSVLPLSALADEYAIYKSTDRGRTWDGDSNAQQATLVLPQPDLTDEPASEAPVWALASGHGLTMAGAAAGTYFSEDGGRHWTRSRTGLPSQAPGIAFLVSDRVVLVSIPTTQAGVRAHPPGGLLDTAPRQE